VSSSTLEPEQEKHRSFHGPSQLFIDLAQTQPLLLVIEDLHWSDDTSLEFSLHLARRIRPSASRGILLLITYRLDEAHASLAHFLASLDRERLATELTLLPLPVADVDLMLRAILGFPRPTPAQLLHAIYTLAEGNPFFVEEVLKSVLTAGDAANGETALAHQSPSEWRIPRSWQDALQ